MIFKMLFERSGGTWLFWWSFVYFTAGMYDVFFAKVDWFPLIQMAWVVIISLPLYVPPLARLLKMKLIWEI